MFALPEPPAKPAPPATATGQPSPTPTPTATLGPLPTLRPTLTPLPAASAVPEQAAGTATPAPTAPPGSTATPLPLVAGGDLLPHNALFVRRHNDFSEPATTGLETLIARGVTLGDTQVQFEPSEPLTGDLVADPTGADALAITYGLSEIVWTGKRDPRATHYLEIALKAAPRSAATGADQAPAANFIFVIDTSGSMRGAKLNGVLTGMRALYAAMRPQDRIGIVDFDVEVRIVLPATQLADLTPTAFNQALDRLVAAGGTDIALGLGAGIAEATGTADTATISYVFLFSDGNPTDGVTEWLQIRAAIVEAVHGTSIRVSTFGFGDDANGRELDALAGVTGGTFTTVSNPAALGTNLAEELARREILVAKDIRLKLEIDPAVSIVHLYGHDQVAEPIARAALESGSGDAAAPATSIGTQEEGLQIYVPDLAAGESYWAVFEVAVPEALDDAIGTAAVTYGDTASGRPVEASLTLTVREDPAKLRDHLVFQHGLSLWSSDVAFYALDDLDQEDYATASARLATHARGLEDAYTGWQRSWLSDDIATVQKLALLGDSLATGRLGTRARTDALALLRYSLETFGRARSGFTPLVTP